MRFFAMVALSSACSAGASQSHSNKMIRQQRECVYVRRECFFVLYFEGWVGFCNWFSVLTLRRKQNETKGDDMAALWPTRLVPLLAVLGAQPAVGKLACYRPCLSLTCGEFQGALTSV